jgi:hypothetical protein
MRLAVLALTLALAACAPMPPPPDRRIGSGEPDWGAISHRIR